jgi:alkylation response protein AidB-like acyl-CoA dehydrogenase
MLRPLLDFLLFDWLAAQNLTQRARYVEHSRETFEAVLDTCERIAKEKFAPFNRLVDTEEPRFDGEKVILPKATHEARAAYVASGMLAANQDEAMGGMQLPFTISAAANSFFALASVSIDSSLLTVGNAGLLLAHGSELQKKVFASAQFSGQWAGTMCLSEPQAGSSLSDITTKAVPDGAGFEQDPLGPRYRLKGNKMWISSGDHELTDNIVHLVLAKIPDENGQLIPGTKGISLFIVPKRMVNAQGQLTGQRNDVALAGLNHKLGWRGTTNTLLNFGEGKFKVMGEGLGSGYDGQGAGAVGYLVGQPHEGLRCMFHMMNEARIGVGTAATMLGLAGYYAALDYAKGRPQGRPMGPAGKNPASPQVPIIAHADVKRMLLAQKAYAEGSLALQLYCAKLVDDQKTAEPAAAEEARLLLEVLIPIAKSWPSEWCLEANSLAIQVHGGYGYTRDFAVEQYWRDNRLNMIHEGTHGIQAADLLGRKVLMEKGRGLTTLQGAIAQTVAKAADVAELNPMAQQLQSQWVAIESATRSAWASGVPEEALANAVPYMQAFGHGVIAWMWLELACVAHAQLARSEASASALANQGRLSAARYFFAYELPKVAPWLAVVASRDMTCASMAADAF